ncbi:MAG: type II toxin-antitoxin system RelE/ParE family toxin [Pseudomonadota bacterium]
MVPSLDLKWSRRALADIARIIDYIAQDKPGAAQALAVAMRAEAEHLRLHPYLGRESLAGVRELVVHRNYLLSYRVKPGRVEILQVWHVARQR